MKFSMFVS